MAENIQPVFAYDDLRGWLAEADKLGEVTTLTGIDKEENIGLASELAMQSDAADCVVFDEIPGHEKGFRVLVNFFGGERKNMTLGFPTELSKSDMSAAIYTALINGLNPVSHEFVEDGPVFQNVHEGDDVDLSIFPAPTWHPEDGGAYLGTGSYDVTLEPESGRLDLGVCRTMVHDRKTVGYHVSPAGQDRVRRAEYLARGEAMPICIVIGGDPMTFLNACAEMRPHACVYDMVGAMRGEALKVVKGKHTGIPFPADAEIVIEGFVDPHETREEGPFGDWTGYYASGARPQPVIHVKAIYHRDDPIILGCRPQRPPDEMCRYLAVTRSAMLRAAIEDAGVPDIAATWAHEVGNSRLLLAVAIKQRYPGHVKQAGHVAAMCHVGAHAGRYVIVTDEDIDVSDLEELTWALITRSDPATSIDIINDAWSTPLDPRIPPWEKVAGNHTNSRAIIDACRPFHWKDAFPDVNAPSPEIARKAREKFGYLMEGRDKP